MKVYIIRHGQTEWNKAMRWQGTKDIPLDATGIEQAEWIAEKLVHFNINRIYSSPLIRTLATAQIIQKKIQSEIVLIDALEEMRIGEWGGLTLAEMEQLYGDIYTQWNSNEAAQVGFGVENFQDLQNRAFNALCEICLKENDSILLVAHGTWMRALVCKLLNIPICHKDSFEISNTGLSILDYDKEIQRFKVLSLNTLL